VRDLLPDDWRHALHVTASADQILIRLCDGEGQAHTLDLRPSAPGAPSLVPGERLRYAYAAGSEEVIDDARLARYRAVLSTLAAREHELAAWMRAVQTPDRAPTNLRGPEWIAFEAGLKPAIRVVFETSDELEALAADARAEGWGFYAPPAPLRFTHYTQRVCYVARTEEEARAIADLEAPEGPDGVRVPSNLPDDNQRLGERLGYPACCTAEFARRLTHGVTRCPDDTMAHEDYAAAAWALAGTVTPHWTLNNLLPDPAPPRLVTWFPCRYDCEASRRFAEALFSCIEALNPQMTATWRDALRQRTRIDRAGHRATLPTSAADVLWVDFDRG
jgi:hypothetical protein